MSDTITRAELIAAEAAVMEALRHVERLIDYRASSYTVVTATAHLNDVVGIWVELKEVAECPSR